jgi:hypothetical protein
MPAYRAFAFPGETDYAGVEREELMASKNRRAYTGRSGQLAVMAELLDQGCNVAIPEVDVGQDVFAFRDDEDVIARIQVKTAHAKPKAAGKYTAQISIPLDQLNHPTDTPELYYVFAVRLKGRWADFLIIERDRLKTLRAEKTLGTVYATQDGKAHLKLDFTFAEGTVTCGRESLQDYRNAWSILPPLKPRGSEAGAPPPEPDTPPQA